MEITRVVALEQINIAVNKGEFVAIVGASGSGKSTLLHILGSVDKTYGGKSSGGGEGYLFFKPGAICHIQAQEGGTGLPVL